MAGKKKCLRINKRIKNKNKLVIGMLILLDFFLIVFMARKNTINYVVIDGKDIFIGETKNLVLGRNYITLVITLFIYFYGVAINKILLRNKIRFIYMILIFLGILILNMLMFYLFTNKVY